LELALNLIWLGISCALLVLGIPLIRQKGIVHSRWVGVMALVCVLCLLFPVISMTDDLHNIPAVVETKKSKNLVAAAHALVALLSGFSFQLPSPVAVAIRNRETLRFPVETLLPFDLNRRPPPARVSLFV
jgi:hypothetical protein